MHVKVLQDNITVVQPALWVAIASSDRWAKMLHSNDS